MIHFDERRSHHYNRRPADEEVKWKNGWGGTSRRGSSNSAAASGYSSVRRSVIQFGTSTNVVPTQHRIDVKMTRKSHLYKSVYWMHPNMAITREACGQEELIGEFIFCQATNSNVIVNYFAGLDVEEKTNLRFAHTAHTPPVCKIGQSVSEDYLRRNMASLVQKIDVLSVERTLSEMKVTSSNLS